MPSTQSRSTQPHNILVLGGGKIGSAISHLLLHSGDYTVTVGDSNAALLSQFPNHPRLITQQLDISDSDALHAAMQQQFAVLSALPFHLMATVAKAAVATNTHYLDLTEDVGATQTVKQLAQQAPVALIPQCGLAPGFISIAAYDLAKRFDQLDSLHMRVGALPLYPSNALKYNLTWSTDGLINEYCNPCEAVIDGKLTTVLALEELESFSLDGVSYEAFNTSGGLGTLCETLAGKVRTLNYRTVRYPGHRDVMKLLLHDLRLKDKRPLLKEILETALPITLQDVVLVFVNASGQQQGRFMQETYVNKIYSQEVHGKLLSAIQLTTASGICAVVDLLAEGKIPGCGFIKQEDINFSDFLDNRFGRYYLQADFQQAHQQHVHHQQDQQQLGFQHGKGEAL